MASLSNTLRRGSSRVSDPQFMATLFSDRRFSVIWLVVRLYLGYQWIEASLHKITSPDWMVTGAALKGFWAKAVAIPAAPAKPAISYEWYRAFLQGMLAHGDYVWFAKVVSVGEFLIGVGLILGAFVGVAAFFGALMNWNFMMAGSASTNPMLFILAIVLILAWKTAGWLGFDRVLLPLLGTPWNPGTLFDRAPGPGEPEPVRTKA
jgi:thiosulfate dehydrogenase (quinone) large subunit